MNFEAYLDQHGTLVYTNVGKSMLPLLRQGRDLMVIEKRPPGRLRRFDAVLYSPVPGRYILHRIIAVRETDYVILGDNCIRKETGITDDQILGVLTAIRRGSRTIRADSFGVRAFVRVWYALYPLRRLLRIAAGRLRRMIGAGKTEDRT